MTSAATMITGAHRTQEWLRARPLLIDAFFAGLIGLLALADLSGDGVGDPARDADLLAVMLVVVAAASLTWRRVAPVAVFVFIIAISCVFYARDYGSFMAAVGLAGIYAVAVHAGNRRAAWILLAAGSVLLVGVASFTLLDASDGFRWAAALSMTTSIGATILAGTVIRNKDEIFADTKQRAERAEADRKIEAEQAVTRERLRIAREMHDVVAHGMSLMTVQAAAAQEVVETRPADAVRLMHSVETTGRDALAEMRRMLGVLRNDEPADGAAGRDQLVPQPSLGDIGTVITHCVEAGTPTELTISGDQRALAPGIELAAFRTVQEALTNVVKHGGAAATAAVELHYGVDTIHVEVSDTGRGVVSSLSRSSNGFDLSHGHGHGLIGMRERIEIYDGQLSAGPQPGGGYTVKASLPIKPRSAPSAVASKDSETVE